MKWPEQCEKCGGIKSSIILETGDQITGYDTIKICNCPQSSEGIPSSSRIQTPKKGVLNTV